MKIIVTALQYSEQQLVDCNWRSGGCHGGWIGNSWDYLVRYGAVTEEAYPYKAKVTTLLSL